MPFSEIFDQVLISIIPLLPSFLKPTLPKKMTDAHGVINVMDTEPVVDNGGAEMVSHSEEIDELRKNVNELNKFVSGLVEKNLQNAKIRTLEKRQFDINQRLRAQERYSRNDSIIICNPPFDSKDNRNVLENTLWYLNEIYRNENMTIKAKMEMM